MGNNPQPPFIPPIALGVRIILIFFGDRALRSSKLVRSGTSVTLGIPQIIFRILSTYNLYKSGPFNLKKSIRARFILRILAMFILSSYTIRRNDSSFDNMSVYELCIILWLLGA